MAPAGAGRTHREIDALQTENRAEIHVDRRIHRLENKGLSQEFRVMFLLHNPFRFDDGFGGGIVPEDTSDFVPIQIVPVHACHLQGLGCSHEGIFRLLGESSAQMAVDDALERGPGHDPCQRRLETILKPLRLQADTGFPLIQGFFHLFDAGPDAGPDSHSTYNDTTHISKALR